MNPGYTQGEGGKKRYNIPPGSAAGSIKDNSLVRHQPQTDGFVHLHAPSQDSPFTGAWWIHLIPKCEPQSTKCVLLLQTQ